MIPFFSLVFLSPHIKFLNVIEFFNSTTQIKHEFDSFTLNLLQFCFLLIAGNSYSRTLIKKYGFELAQQDGRPPS